MIVNLAIRNTVPLSTTSPHFGRLTPKPETTTPFGLISLDLDDALFPWKEGKRGVELDEDIYQGSVDALKKAWDSNLILMNSGRCLSELTPTYIEALKQLPIDGFSTMDGRELYLNQSSQDEYEQALQNDQAMESITCAWLNAKPSEDESYLTYMKPKGWDTQTALKTIGAVIEKERTNIASAHTDFDPLHQPANPNKVTTLETEAPFFHLLDPDPKNPEANNELVARGNQIAQEIVQRLQNQGLQLTSKPRLRRSYRIEKNGPVHYYSWHFDAQNVKKDTPIDFLVQQDPEIQYVVSVGDEIAPESEQGGNDHAMLARDCFNSSMSKSRCNFDIPNFAFAINAPHRDPDRFKSHFQKLQQHNPLAQAIEQRDLPVILETLDPHNTNPFVNKVQSQKKSCIQL